MRDKIIKTDAEWREQLTPEQYQVTRAHGTERAFLNLNLFPSHQLSFTGSSALKVPVSVLLLL